MNYYNVKAVVTKDAGEELKKFTENYLVIADDTTDAINKTKDYLKTLMSTHSAEIQGVSIANYIDIIGYEKKSIPQAPESGN